MADGGRVARVRRAGRHGGGPGGGGPGSDRAAAKERRLHVASAEASSYLVNDWNKFQENYLPLYVGDDDPKTAWSLKTEGIGEWLRVHVTQMEGATQAADEDPQRLPEVAQAVRGERARQGADRHAAAVEEDASTSTLTDTQGWQEIAVDQPAGPLEAVELKVKSVYAGKKYDDLCISDVQLFVTATSSDNPAFEKQRLTKIVAWKKERVAAAKLFQTKLGQVAAHRARSTRWRRRRDRRQRVPATSAGRGRRDAVLHGPRAGRAAQGQGRQAKHAAALRTGQRSGGGEVRGACRRCACPSRDKRAAAGGRRPVHAQHRFAARGPVRRAGCRCRSPASSATWTRTRWR